MRHVVWSPNGQRFAKWTDGEINVEIWDVGAMARVASIKPEEAPSPYHVLGWSPDGSRFLTYFYGTVFLWDAVAWKRVETLSIYASESSLAFSPDGSRLALSGSFGRLMLVDPRSGAKLDEQSMHNPAAALQSAVWWSPDNTTTVYADGSGLVQLRNSQTGRVRRTLRHADDAAPNFPAVAFSPSGGRLALMTDGKAIQLLRAGTGEEEHAIPTGTAADAFHPSGPGHLAFSPDGSLIAAITADRAVRVWDVTSGQVRVTLQKPGEANSSGPADSIGFSSTGKYLAWKAADDGSFGLWSTDGGSEPRSLRGSKPTAETATVEWSPRGDTLAWCGPGGIELWSAAECKPVGDAVESSQGKGTFVPGTDVFSVAGQGLVLRRGHDGKTALLELTTDGKLRVRDGTGKDASSDLLKDVLGRE